MPTKKTYLNNGVTRLMGHLDKSAKRNAERLAGKR